MIENVQSINKLKGFLRSGWLIFEANKPAVMTGIAMGGAIVLTGTSAQAAVNTYKAKDKIKDLDLVDKAKVIVPYWVETLIVLLFVEIMIFGANRENAKRIAALAGAYSLSEQTLKEYREKAEEIVGSKKAGEIKQAIYKDYAEKENMATEIIETGKGTTLFKDLSTGRKFYCDRWVIEDAVISLNTELNEHGPASRNPCLYFVSKNDFYRAIGLEEIQDGEVLGWNSFSGDLVKVDITSEQLRDGSYINYLEFLNLSPTYDDTNDYMV